MKMHRFLGPVRRGAGALLVGGCAGAVLLAVSAAVLLLGGCAGSGARPSVDSGLRPTNVELYIASQSCFQGEVVPCG